MPSLDTAAGKDVQASSTMKVVGYLQKLYDNYFMQKTLTYLTQTFSAYDPL